MRHQAWLVSAVASLGAVLLVPAHAQDPAPQIFAPGVVSTEAPEFATTFSPDGHEVYFNRATSDRSAFPIFRSILRDGKWTPAEAVPFAADGRNPDPFMTADGSRIYFSSNRPKTTGGAVGDFDIWYVARRGTGWSSPMNLGPKVNSDKNDLFPSVTRDGSVYFSSDRSGSSKIYRAQQLEISFADPEPLPDVVNAGGAGNPAISVDERLLFFSSSRPGGLGGEDLYVCERRNGQWTTPRNLGPGVNSSYADFAPAIGPDGRLYFTSERPGIVTAPAGARPPGDIYSVALRAIGL